MKKTNKKQKFEVDVDLLKDLEAKTGLHQKQIIDEMGKVGFQMGLRTFQRIFTKGEEHTKDVINKVAVFFASYLPNENITFESLLKEKITQTKTSKDNKKVNPLLIDHKEETTFLRRVRRYSPFEQIIKRSSLRKFYYPILPNSDQLKAIENTVAYITEIHQTQNSQKNQMVDTDKFSQIDTELFQLKTFSNFSNILNDLNSTGVELYAGNYILHDIKTVHKVSDNKLILNAGVVGKTYSIFCFDKTINVSKTLKYLNPFFKEKAEAELKENPKKEVIANSDDEDAYSIYDNDVFHQYYGFDPEDPNASDYNYFDRNRSRIYTTPIKELSVEQNKKLLKGKKFRNSSSWLEPRAE